VCNDQDVDICVVPMEAMLLARFARPQCYPGNNNGPFSSQIFTYNQGGYNVVEGYADCKNDPPSKAPSEYAYADSPLGMPKVICGLEGGEACAGASKGRCIDDSVVILSSTYETCHEYMAATYAPAGSRKSQFISCDCPKGREIVIN